MKIAFYYHVPIAQINATLFAPSYLSVFINELSSQIDFLVLVMHEATEKEIIDCDGQILNQNIEWFNLGIKTPAWHRIVYYNNILKGVMNSLNKYDVLLVRAPSPLAPYFSMFSKRIKLVYMVVGDYSENVRNMRPKSFREVLIYIFLIYNNCIFERRIKNTDVLVNSPILYEKYKLMAKAVYQIRTTTLLQGDFFDRNDTCEGDVINLLYTGRIDNQKGLFELFAATSLLIKNGYNVVCNIVGWDPDIRQKTLMSLIELSKAYKISNNVIFHGKKKVGFELNQIYRSCDIYVIPSYHEGFPRTIWEAMANGLPVVATKVGAIPIFLRDNYHAILIESKEIIEIHNAIVKILEDKVLRQNLIRRGLELAKENTLENRVKELLKSIDNVAID